MITRADRLALPLLAVAALLAPGVASYAQDTPPAPPPDPNKTYSPIAKFVVGDLLQYKMQMTANISVKSPDGNSPLPGPMEMKMNASVRMKTAGVKPDGTGVISVRLDNGEMQMMGNQMPFPPMPDIVMEVNPRGMAKMRDMGAVPGGEIMSQMMNMNNMPSMGVVFPDHPVKIGETCEAEMPTPTSGKIKFVCTLLGVEKVAGVDTLRIKQVTTMPMDMKIGADQKPTADASKAMMAMSGTVTSSGIYNIGQDTSRLLKVAADISSAMSMTLSGPAAQQSPVGGKMDMTMNGKMSMDLTSATKVGTVPIK